MNSILRTLLLLLTCVLLFNACKKNDDDASDDTTDDEEVVDDSTDDEEEGEEEIDCESVFEISKNTIGCVVDIEEELGVTSLYEETITGTTRHITINNIPPHNVGVFPNIAQPNNTIAEIEEVYEVTTQPELASEQTSTQATDTERWASGVLFSAVALEVNTIETFVNPETDEANSDWNVVALQSVLNLGLDCNNSHVQNTGQYHVHGLPAAYADYLGIGGPQEMYKIGYAADGFPIYYRFGYDDDNEEIIAYEAGYTLKEGNREGDGITAPDGCYDGTYFQDYEYTGGTGLDECNGRIGKTPESDSEYYYIITENWPSAPICFSGTPDQSFNDIANLANNIDN